MDKIPEASKSMVKLKTAKDHTKDPPAPTPKAARYRQCPHCEAIVSDADDDWSPTCPSCGAALSDGLDPIGHTRALRDRRLDVVDEGTPKRWACPTCGQPHAVFVGLPGKERCLKCWIEDPGYDRPVEDPYMQALED